MADVLISTLTGSSVIKSIQRGTVTSAGEVTISTINPSKSVLTLLGFTYGGSSVSSVNLSGLTSGNFIVKFQSAGSPGFTVSWQVVEYY